MRSPEIISLKAKFARGMAKSIAILLQPFLMPFYSVALLFVYTNFHFVYAEQALRFLFPVFVFSFFVPFLFTLILYKLKYIDDLASSSRQSLVLPYLIFFTSNSCLTYFFYTAGISPWFVGLLFVFPLIALVGFIINFFWKISPYMLGIGGLIGGVLSICFNVKGVNPFMLFIILFILAGSLGVARLYLKRDTPAQVYIGFLVGLVLAYFSVILGMYIILMSFN